MLKFENMFVFDSSQKQLPCKYAHISLELIWVEDCGRNPSCCDLETRALLEPWVLKPWSLSNGGSSTLYCSGCIWSVPRKFLGTIKNNLLDINSMTKKYIYIYGLKPRLANLLFNSLLLLFVQLETYRLLWPYARKPCSSLIRLSKVLLACVLMLALNPELPVFTEACWDTFERTRTCGDMLGPRISQTIIIFIRR